MPALSDLHKICGMLERGEIDRTQFLDLFTRQLTAEIGCSRAGVRMLVDTPAGRALRCLAMYDAAQSRVVSPADLPTVNSEPYFEALLRNGCVVAPDARTHPATVCFGAVYLVPSDVYSMMDVGFSVNGMLFGTFSCEEVGATMAWTQRQLQLLRKTASRASLSLLHAVTSQVDTDPGALWETSSPNRLVTMPMSLDAKN